jgi:hypothetical protein
VWPYVVVGVLAVVVMPFVVLAACGAALSGGAAKAVDAASAGGSVNVGESYTYASGVAISASVPKQVTVGNKFIVDPKK